VTGPHWGIVGGGMLGLTLAHRLAGAGHRVTVLEAAPALGGLASAWSLDGVVWDRHYHVTLLSDARLRNLLAELGLEDDLRWKETRTGCWADGRLHSVSNTIEFLRFPPLRMVDKLRLGATIVYGSRIRDGRRLEKVPVGDWLSRWSGRRTYERFWLPLLRSKLGENHRDASAAFIWATIQRLYAARRSGLKKELFGYVPGGYARVLDRFGAVLAAEGVEVVTGARARSVEGDGDGVTVAMADGTARRFDRAVVTAAAPLAARLCPQLDGEERRRLEAVRYQGIVCVSLLLRRPLGPYYLTYLTDDDLPFTAIVEMTTLVDPDQLDGHALVYLPKYVTPDDPLLDAPDEEIVGEFLPYLRKVHPDLADEDVRCARVSKVRHVLAVATLGYSDALPPTATSVPGVHLVNSAHIVNGTLNVDETVRLAERAAAELAAAG
jgi:protoporphyrinogen oxidase